MTACQGQNCESQFGAQQNKTMQNLDANHFH